MSAGAGATQQTYPEGQESADGLQSIHSVCAALEDVVKLLDLGTAEEGEEAEDIPEEMLAK